MEKRQNRELEIVFSMKIDDVTKKRGEAIARLDGISLSARVRQLINADYERRHDELARAGLLVEEAQGEK